MANRLIIVGMWLACALPAAGQENCPPESALRIGAPQTSSPVTVPNEPPEKPVSADQLGTRTTIELSAAVTRGLQAEATASWPAERLAAVQQLSALYDELSAHERFAKSQLLRRQHRRIFVRLVRLYDELRRERCGMPAAEHPAQRDANKPGSAVLAQVVAAGAIAGPPAGGPPPGAGAGDHADELIDVITRTIRPETWTELGGPSTITYYRPSLALVLTAPQEVHEAVAQLLGDLRAASGP